MRRCSHVDMRNDSIDVEHVASIPVERLRDGWWRRRRPRRFRSGVANIVRPAFAFAVLTLAASGCGGAIATSPSSDGGSTPTSSTTTSASMTATSTSTNTYNSASSTTTATATETSGLWCDVLAENYDHTCMIDSDCTLVLTGNLCSGTGCPCADSTISATALPQYNADVAKTGSTGRDFGCSCPNQPGPCCRQGQCTTSCQPTTSEADAACIPGVVAGGPCEQGNQVCNVGSGACPAAWICGSDSTWEVDASLCATPADAGGE